MSSTPGGWYATMIGAKNMGLQYPVDGVIDDLKYYYRALTPNGEVVNYKTQQDKM